MFTNEFRFLANRPALAQREFHKGQLRHMFFRTQKLLLGSGLRIAVALWQHLTKEEITISYISQAILELSWAPKIVVVLDTILSLKYCVQNAYISGTKNVA